MPETSSLKTRADEDAAAWPSDRVWVMARGNPVLATLQLAVDCGSPAVRAAALAEAWCDSKELRFLSARVRPNGGRFVVDVLAAPRVYTIEVRR